MFRKTIFFKDFLNNKNKINKKKVLENYSNIINEENEILLSLSKKYKDSFSKNIFKKFSKIKKVYLIGMGGSILGAKAIYNFLDSSKKIFYFVDNFASKKIKEPKINLIISKSGNTLETIGNSNILIDIKKDRNIFITENKKNYLNELASKLKSEIIHHNNFIGGRYSVLSEVGMLPAQLMGYNPAKFRKFNQLVKNKHFTNTL